MKVNKITIVLSVIINRGRKGDNMKAADICHSAKMQSDDGDLGGSKEMETSWG